MKAPIVHQGVAGTREDGANLVPWCDAGYAAFKRGALAVVTTVPSGVDCKFCLNGQKAIKVTYSSIDRARISRRFKTLKGARTFAQKYVGTTPEISGMGYAVSQDGIGKVEVDGVAMRELFPALPAIEDDNELGV